MSRPLLATLLAAVLLLGSTSSEAQHYPSQPVKLLVGGAPGSVPDLMIRPVAERLSSAPRMLVRDDLDAGTLVAPFGFVPGPYRLVIWTAPHLSGRPEAHALEEWLMKELKQAEE